MSEKTKLEKKFIEKVRKFMKSKGVTLHELGKSEAVHYSNIKKLKEFFVEERGAIQSNVMGRIDSFVDNYKKK